MMLLLLLAVLVRLSLQQDPVQNFCRRFGHQTAVIGRRLFIDGGQVNYNPLSQYPGNSSNTDLLYNALDDITSDGMPQLLANLSKPSYVPDVSDGILWADEVNGIIYQFGGQFSVSPQPFQLWAYDAVYNTWNLTQLTTSSVQRTAFGAGLVVNQTATGYYYGGWQSNATTPGWNAAPQLSNSIVTYDMIGNQWTIAQGPDSIGRAEGAMTFLPASDGGLLIYFGGLEDAGNGSTTGSDMSAIHIFDIDSSKWYVQTATGDVPQSRRRFCAGAAWPKDQSSYNIYLYGGAGIAPNTTGFDDVYILSLPTFTWIKWWPMQPGSGNPHNSMTCNVIGGSQMLIIGGTFPLDDTCDSPNVWGTHNLNLGENGPNRATWDKFYPNITTYDVPDAVVAKVGGSMSGGATNTQPHAWDDRDLPVYFSRQASLGERTATRIIPPATALPGATGGHRHSTSIGSIVGGVVGGVVALCLMLLLGFFCCMRKREADKDESLKELAEKPTVRETSPQELPTHRWSSVEPPPHTSLRSPSSTASHFARSESQSSLNSLSPTLTGTSPTYGGHYNPPAHLGAVFEDQPSQFSAGQEQQQPQSPTVHSPQPLSPEPYDPREHALHHQYFQPPASPPSAQNTPLNSYRGRRKPESDSTETDEE